MKFKNKIFLLTVIFLFIYYSMILAQAEEAPAPIAVALLVKVIGFEKNISSGDITIYVLGSSDVTKELKKVIGQANIKSVQSGNDLPSSIPSILFIYDAKKAEKATKYTQDNKILSVTSLPDLVTEGVTLGFGVGSDNKPKILLNINSSAKEELNWNPAIMKVAQIIK